MSGRALLRRGLWVEHDGTVQQELRDREKVTRNLNEPDTLILASMQIFHNYVGPHMALNGQTPADKAGIKVKRENKWMTLIQNASRKMCS